MGHPWLLVGIVVMAGAAVGVRPWLRARGRGLERKFVDLPPLPRVSAAWRRSAQ